MVFLLTFLGVSLIGVVPSRAEVNKLPHFSTLDMISVCMDDEKPRCLILGKNSKKKNSGTETVTSLKKKKTKRIPLTEFRRRAEEIGALAKTVHPETDQCSPSILLSLTTVSHKMRGRVCADDYSEKDWERWTKVIPSIR